MTRRTERHIRDKIADLKRRKAAINPEFMADAIEQRIRALTWCLGEIKEL